MDLSETKHTFVCMPGKAALQSLTKKFRERLKNNNTQLPCPNKNCITQNFCPGKTFQNYHMKVERTIWEDIAKKQKKKSFRSAVTMHLELPNIVHHATVTQTCF